MPFIDSKVTLKISMQQKEEIKSELGKLIETLNKSETYLMVHIEDACDLWLGGKKLEKAPMWLSACTVTRQRNFMTG